MMLFRPRFRRRIHIIIGLIFYAALISIVITQPPTNGFIIMLFFVCLFMGTLFALRFVLNRRRSAILISSGLSLFLLLRLWELRHILYPLLIFAICLTIELYFRNNKRKDVPGTK